MNNKLVPSGIEKKNTFSIFRSNEIKETIFCFKSDMNYFNIFV